MVRACPPPTHTNIQTHTRGEVRMLHMPHGMHSKLKIDCQADAVIMDCEVLHMYANCCRLNNHPHKQLSSAYKCQSVEHFLQQKT